MPEQITQKYQELPLPLQGGAYKNISEEAVNTGFVGLVNMLPTEKDTYVIRSGLELFCDLGTGSRVDGLGFYPGAGLNGKVYAVSNGTIFGVDLDGTDTSLETGAMSAGTPVIFANQGNYFFMCNGGSTESVKYVEKATPETVSAIGGDAPKGATHCVILDSRLWLIDGSRMYWSGVDDFVTFAGLADSTTAIVSPDDISFLGLEGDHLILGGDDSIERFYTTGNVDFEVLRNSSLQVDDGIVAPYTMQKYRDEWYYLNEDNQIVTLAGTIPKVLSTPYDDVIGNLPGLDGAVAYIIRMKGHVLYVINFPIADRTIFFDITYSKTFQTDNAWGEFASWNLPGAKDEAWQGFTHLFVKKWQMHLVGDRSNGKIYKLKKDVYTDESVKFRTKLLTGHFNHGTPSLKQSEYLALGIKRGVGTYTDSPDMLLRWKDDNTTWGRLVDLEMGLTGETQPTKVLKPMGVYHQRQYELTTLIDGNVEFFGMNESVRLYGGK